MKNLILIICLMPFAAQAQLPAFQFDRPALKDIPLTEKMMKGKRFEYNFPITVAKDYFPGATKHKLANPFVYYRPDGNTAAAGGAGQRIEVSYFYSVPDKIVRLVEYSFDRTAADTAALKQQFAYNDSSFSAFFKKPAAVSTEIHDTWWQQIDIWENERLHIKQFIVIGENTYRLRVLVSWKDKAVAGSTK
jgi:hypothetical protein